MTTIIDTPEGIAAFRALTLYRALKLKVETGLSMTRINVAPIIKREYGLTARTNRDLLTTFEAILRDEGILS